MVHPRHGRAPLISKANEMVQAAGRFSSGFAACSILTLVFLFVARSFLVSTIQTAESDPHSEVLYAGLAPETLFATLLTLAVAAGCVFLTFSRRSYRTSTSVAVTGLATLMLVANVGVMYVMLLETLWLGFD